MRLIITLLITSVLCSSCFKSTENTSGLKDNVYQELLKYQKENPAIEEQENGSNKNHQIYQAILLPPKYANPDEHEFSLFITLSVLPESITEKKYYGIYKDKNLKETVIVDEANNFKALVNTIKTDNFEKFRPKNSSSRNRIYPVKMFNIKGNQLIYMATVPGNTNR